MDFRLTLALIGGSLLSFLFGIAVAASYYEARARHEAERRLDHMMHILEGGDDADDPS